MDIYRKDKSTLEKFLYVMVESKAMSFFVAGIFALIVAVIVSGKPAAEGFTSGVPFIDDNVGNISWTVARVLLVVVIGSGLFVFLLVRYRRLERQAKKEESEAREKAIEDQKEKDAKSDQQK